MLDNTPMQDQQIPPYHLPGRWYKVEFVFNDDEGWPRVTKSDLPDAAFLPNPDRDRSFLFLGHRFYPVDFHLCLEYDSYDHDFAAFDFGDNIKTVYRIGNLVTGLNTAEFAVGIIASDGSDLFPTFKSGTIYIFGYFMP